jgi:hypothetical protein
MLPVLVPLLRREGELDLTDADAVLLMRMSAAKIDRKLAPERAKLALRGRSHTKPGSLLKSQIPIKTWRTGTTRCPGSLRSTWSDMKAVWRPDRAASP